MRLAGGDNKYRAGDAIGNPLGNVSPEQSCLGPVAKDLNPDLRKRPGHEGLPDLLMKRGRTLPEGLRKEYPPIKDQRSGADLNGLGWREGLRDEITYGFHYSSCGR